MLEPASPAQLFPLQPFLVALSAEGLRISVRDYPGWSLEGLIMFSMACYSLGFATDQFNAQQGAVAVELSDLLAQASRSSDEFALACEIGLAWAVRNDLRNYAVLGDPAVRLAR
jgi:hypothetical protein